MPYTSNLTATIADVMGQPARARADALRRSGDAQARAAEVSGQAWGNAAQNIGHIAQSTLGDVMRERQQAPIRAAQLQGQADQHALATATLADRQRGIDDAAALDTVNRPGATREQVLAGVPGHLRSAIEKQYAEADAAAERMKQSRRQAAIDERDYLGSVAAGVRANHYSPTAAEQAFQHAEEQGYDVRALREQLRDPAQIQQATDRLIAQSPKQVELDRADAAQAETGRHNLAAEKTTAQNAADAAARAATTQAETERHNKAMEARPVAGAANAAGTLDEDGLDLAATAYRLTKSLPARDSKQNGAIISRAAAQAKQLGNSPVTTIQKQAAYQADSKALAKMQGMASAAEAFETKANAQAGLVSDLSTKVGRTQFPVINEALLAGKEYLGGDENTHLFSNALLTFTSEYAKIMEGSTGSAAGSSEGARRDAAKLISTALNDGTIQKTVKQMQWEMQQTIRGYDVTIAHISDRMGGQPTQPAATERWIRDASGKLVRQP